MNEAPPCSIGLLQGGVYMIGHHNVMIGNETIGDAVVTKEGLYYRICCKCKLSGDVVCRLEIHWDDKSESLGVLVPEADSFSVNTKLSAKRLGNGQPVFRVMPKHEKLSGKFVPIRADEPFAYLSELEKAYLKTSAEAVGIMIPEGSAPVPQDSDQTQEYQQK